MTEISARFKLEKDCKHSRRYRCEDEDFPVRDVYIKRPFANQHMELEIVLRGTITEVAPPETQ